MLNTIIRKVVRRPQTWTMAKRGFGSYLGNYHVIIGDVDHVVEKKTNGTISPVQTTFEIEGRDKGGSKVVMLMVKGLNEKCSPVNVDINGVQIGQIYPTPGAHPDAWQTQILHYDQNEGRLRPNWEDDSITNDILIPGPVRPEQDAEKTNQFKQFSVRNITLLYRQAV